MNMQRKASVFRNGRNQAIRIPKDMELAVKQVLVTKDGDKLVIEPLKVEQSLGEWLATLEPLPPEDRFPEIDDPPPEDPDFRW